VVVLDGFQEPESPSEVLALHYLLVLQPYPGAALALVKKKKKKKGLVLVLKCGGVWRERKESVGKFCALEK
jgi:hypothetical protein